MASLGRRKRSDTLWQRSIDAILACHGPQEEVRAPHGHGCAVCGQTVRKGHPIHRAERPDRSAAPIVRFNGQTAARGRS